MSIPESQLRDIRERINLVDYIGRTVELKKAAGAFVGLCPFHNEKTPSFNVSPRGTWKCFGCNEGGDVFGFVMKAQGLGFPDAVRALAVEAGVEVEAKRSRGAGGGRDRLGSRSSTQATRPATPQPRPAGAEVRSIGDARGAKVVQTYDYTNRRGGLVYQVCRMEPKSFRQRRPDPARPGEWIWSMKAGRGLPDQPTILYRIPELAAAIAAEDPIFVAEGEKDVEALRDHEQVATCNTAGAGKWRDELAAPFQDYSGQIRIVRDRDEPGEEHARKVFESLHQVIGKDATLVIVEPAEGKDASDHFAAGKTVEDFVQIWPLPADLIDTDPKRFKVLTLRKALEAPATVLDHTRHADYEHRDYPLFYAGIAALTKPMPWQGCVVISGEPSAGKSYVAIATGTDSADAGWDVFYLSCEMPQREIRTRAARAVASRTMLDHDWQNGQTRERFALAAKTAVLPDRFNIVDVGIGVTIEDVVGFLSEHVTERPTLVVLDSISSFIDNMVVNPSDSFGMTQLREVTRWVTQLSKLSHGQISFLLLSELNKEGRAKGRSLDHRCNFALAMESGEEEGHAHVKAIRTSKSWHGPTGKHGQFVLWWQLGRMSRVPDPRPL